MSCMVSFYAPFNDAISSELVMICQNFTLYGIVLKTVARKCAKLFILPRYSVQKWQ